MILIQLRIDFKGNDQNHIALDLLEREDANEAERATARAIEDLFRAIYLSVAAQLPDGEVTITEIPPRDTSPAAD